QILNCKWDALSLTFAKSLPLAFPPRKRQQTMIKKDGVMLHVGNKLFLGQSDFEEIVNGNHTFIDKTLLIAEFLDETDPTYVALVLRPRRFGKTTNITMLKKFLSIPIHPDNELYRRELFKGTLIETCDIGQDLFEKHFCKHPVISFSLRGFEDCSTFYAMANNLRGLVAKLYKEHSYLINNTMFEADRERFQLIYQENKYPRIGHTLFELSEHLARYHRKKCVVLIDEYDHPMDIAYRHGYYGEARDLFASLMGSLLKDNENLWKAFLVGVSRVAQTGYLSGLHNVEIYSMHAERYADKFGFTHDETSIILEHYELSEKMDAVKCWYDGYEAYNGLHIYNPLSVNKFISTKELDTYWVDTAGGTQTISMLLWHSTENFKNDIISLLDGNSIKGSILPDLYYGTLDGSDSAVLRTLLYYAGYLTKDKSSNMENGDILRIPNKEVKTQWLRWLQGSSFKTVHSLVNKLLAGRLSDFINELKSIIKETLLFHDLPDKQVESNYHLFIVGLLALVRDYGHECKSNREEGYGRFDYRITPTEKAIIFRTAVIMEFKIRKSKNKDDEEFDERDLQKLAMDALQQIDRNQYDTGLSSSSANILVKCGIAFQGKDCYAVGTVFKKEGDKWVMIDTFKNF
ncbi:4056_t:CDS:2, partial [Ambispora leptoticha]